MIKCLECGTENPSKRRVCKECGERLHEVRQTRDLPTNVDLPRGFQPDVPLLLEVYNDVFLPGQPASIRFKLANQGVKAWKSVDFKIIPDKGCGVFRRASPSTQQMYPGQESEIIAFYIKLADNPNSGTYPGVVRIQIEDDSGDWPVYDCDQFHYVTVKEADVRNLSIHINKTQNAGQGGVVYNPEDYKEGLLRGMQPVVLEYLKNLHRLPVGFKPGESPACR